jgi:hypothetical protein
VTLSRRAVAAAFVAVTIGYVAVGAAVLDIHLRKILESRTGLNSFGYRGVAKFTKAPGERRVAIVGGSAAFSVGVPAQLTFGRVVEAKLNQPRVSRGLKGLISVVELAELGAGANSYPATLDDYAYLDADVVCVFDGYAAAGDVPPGGGRRGSWVFRLIGYRPVLFGGTAIQSGAVTDVPVATLLTDRSPADMSCRGLSRNYCSAMVDTVERGLARGKAVVVAAPPFISQRHRDQQAALAAALQTRFGADRRFKYFDGGATVDLGDPMFSFDHVHLTAEGISRLAEGVVGPLRSAIEKVSASSPIS